MKIIGIAGLKNAGKDTLAQIITAGFRAQGVAFADPLKRSAVGVGFPSSALWGESDARKFVHPDLQITARTYCQKEGEFWRSQDPDHWVKLFAGAVELIKKGASYHKETGAFHGVAIRVPPEVLFVTDLRHQNEHDYLKSIGAKTILIVRPGTDDGDQHVSEKWCREEAINVVDLVYHNDSTLEDLQQKADGTRRWLDGFK